MDDGVELLGDARVEVVALGLRRGPIHHADGALETGLSQRAERLAGIAQREEESRQRHFVEKRFHAARQRGDDAHSLGRTVPLVRCGDRSVIRGEADE